MMKNRNVLALFIAPLLLTLHGCAGPIQRWIVDTRINQGAVALDRGNLGEAQLAYRLALKVDPSDPRARTGYSQAEAQVSTQQYTTGRLDDALETVNSAIKYDPQNVRLAALKSDIEQAKIKREIVVSNYPNYKAAGEDIRLSYLALKSANMQIIAALKKFDYTYDTNVLNKAIVHSYQLHEQVAKNTNKLMAFRQLVEAGVPEAQKGEGQSVAPPASLLPLP